MMKKLPRYLILTLMALTIAVAGCSSKGTTKAGDEPGGPNAGMTPGGGPGSGDTGEGGDGTKGPGGSAVDAPGERVVYFDYDKSDIRADARAVLEAHAAYLQGHPFTIRLEGHADERGSREYNLALGERRAESVKRALGIMGVTESLMNTLSYGEERPIDPGHNETSWQINRRVEIIYP